jgi:predicted phosphodiesterase
VVMGNVEESLGQGLDNCGCGFKEGSDCDVLSVQWFAHTRDALGDDDKGWMAALPRKLEFTMNGRKIAVIHGAAEKMDRFVFHSDPATEKNRDLDTLGVDGIIAGHCGLPFTDIIDGRMWHNAGVVGMPANDGTPRTWYSVLTPGPDGIAVRLCPLDYDHAAASSSIYDKGLPDTYARTLKDGLWPNMDVLPAAEREMRGQALAAQNTLWR